MPSYVVSGTRQVADLGHRLGGRSGSELGFAPARRGQAQRSRIKFLMDGNQHRGFSLAQPILMNGIGRTWKEPKKSWSEKSNLSLNKISWSVIGITNIVLRGKFMGLGESDIYEQKGEIMKYKFEGKTINVTLGNKNYKVKLERGSYEGGRIAILGYLSDGEPFSTLSVNIPDIKLLEDEILIKNWSENEAFAKSALQSGYFLNTGKSVRTGFVEAPIWLLIREGDI